MTRIIFLAPWQKSFLELAQIPRYARINALKWTVDEAIKTFQKSGFALGDPLSGMCVPLVRSSIRRGASAFTPAPGTSHGTRMLKTFSCFRHRRILSKRPSILMAASSSKIRRRVSPPSCLLHRHTRGVLSSTPLQRLGTKRRT